MSVFDAETLAWVKNKIEITTGRVVDSRSDVYGSMHVLCSGWQGMERYAKAYKCEAKQGMIANLSVGLQNAIDRLELLGQDCGELRTILIECDEILGCRWALKPGEAAK